MSLNHIGSDADVDGSTSTQAAMRGHGFIKSVIFYVYFSNENERYKFKTREV
jgi:hypothetical protein